MPAIHCYHCGCVITGNVYYNPSCRTICQNCYNRRYFVCSICGQTYDVGYRHYERNENGQRLVMCDRCWRNSARWEPEEFQDANPTFTQTKSRRQFGVEFETSYCRGYRLTKGRHIYGAKFDGSIRGMEFISPILHGDKGLQSVIDFCNMARNLGWRTDSDCGLHVHFDMRNERTDALKRIAYGYVLTEPFWRTLVNQYRAYECTFCRQMNLCREDIQYEEFWRDFCHARDRYAYCNIHAYYRHGTYEIRLHQGTLSSRAVSNWIKVHLLFIEAMKECRNLNDVEVVVSDPWEAFKNIVADPYLIRFYGRRRSQFKERETVVHPTCPPNSMRERIYNSL